MSRRRASKIDVNQPAFIAELRRLGVEVEPTSHFGEGFPDCLCCYRRELFLVEIKNPEYATKLDLLGDHLGMLTPSQRKMRLRWPIIVALTAAEAVEKMEAIIVSR